VSEGSEAASSAYVRADAPIEGRAHDKLRRAPLAAAIADQVIHGPTGHGLVIGLAGKWGSGKTSILKMVEESVAERSDTVILRFNPWLFAGTEQLVARFLEELAAQLMTASESAGDRQVRWAGRPNASAHTPPAWNRWPGCR
jgi:predicted KAP-like P-loop ATPase